MNTHRKGWEVLVLCILLFLVSFLTPLSAEFQKAAEYKYLPDHVRIYASLLNGAVSGLATIIAFMNSSFGQWRQNGSGKPKEEPKTP